MSVTLRQEAPGGWEVWQPWQVSVACHTGQDVERENCLASRLWRPPGPAWPSGLAGDTDLQPPDFALIVHKRRLATVGAALSCAVAFCDSGLRLLDS